MPPADGEVSGTTASLAGEHQYRKGMATRRISKGDVQQTISRGAWGNPPPPIIIIIISADTS
jgi:hypothetical protein